jgi:hypothetical protein
MRVSSSREAEGEENLRKRMPIGLEAQDGIIREQKTSKERKEDDQESQNRGIMRSGRACAGARMTSDAHGAVSEV